MNIASTLYEQLLAADVPIVGLSIGSSDDKSTWTVQPSDLQVAAQPIIDAFDISAEELNHEWTELRRLRTKELKECDWTQLTDVPLLDAVKLSWIAYRKALRDLPSTTVDPTNPTWPVAPDA